MQRRRAHQTLPASCIGRRSGCPAHFGPHHRLFVWHRADHWCRAAPPNGDAFRLCELRRRRRLASVLAGFPDGERVGGEPKHPGGRMRPEDKPCPVLGRHSGEVCEAEDGGVRAVEGIGYQLFNRCQLGELGTLASRLMARQKVRELIAEPACVLGSRRVGGDVGPRQLIEKRSSPTYASSKG